MRTRITPNTDTFHAVFNWQKYKHKPNFCLNVLRKTKKKTIFCQIKCKNVADNKLFWRNVKPYFSNKGSNSTKIMLKTSL